jgi:hypothetical protein
MKSMTISLVHLFAVGVTVMTGVVTDCDSRSGNIVMNVNHQPKKYCN